MSSYASAYLYDILSHILLLFRNKIHILKCRQNVLDRSTSSSSASRFELNLVSMLQKLANRYFLFKPFAELFLIHMKSFIWPNPSTNCINVAFFNLHFQSPPKLMFSKYNGLLFRKQAERRVSELNSPCDEFNTIECQVNYCYMSIYSTNSVTTDRNFSTATHPSLRRTEYVFDTYYSDKNFDGLLHLAPMITDESISFVLSFLMYMQLGLQITVIIHVNMFIIKFLHIYCCVQMKSNVFHILAGNLVKLMQNALKLACLVAGRRVVETVLHWQIRLGNIPNLKIVS
ncbi:hypothetical protein EGR_05844 [Echinococcus granulosus]|uniref:Uncharacterized protein n=1 Tax=Echinococcus granulosus TaxID=6210 RepID=W6UDF7_ECHGR|nr:hypothetical protein EGR_05844 [Echinococcus granulosus]EUB59360.1 hypothetical protein EGR_05844 [Echinococcus granulosus]